MEPDHTKNVVVFRTGQLFQIDWASNTLKEAGIPFFTREETSGGIRIAMPAAPASGPGVWWSVVVPEQFAEKAKEALSELPFEVGTEPGIWDFKPTRKVKIGWKIYAAAALLLSLIFWVVSIVREVTRDR